MCNTETFLYSYGSIKNTYEWSVLNSYVKDSLLMLIKKEDDNITFNAASMCCQTCIF